MRDNLTGSDVSRIDRGASKFITSCNQILTNLLVIRVNIGNHRITGYGIGLFEVEPYKLHCLSDNHLGAGTTA